MPASHSGLAARLRADQVIQAARLVDYATVFDRHRAETVWHDQPPGSDRHYVMDRGDRSRSTDWRHSQYSDNWGSDRLAQFRSTATLRIFRSVMKRSINAERLRTSCASAAVDCLRSNRSRSCTTARSRSSTRLFRFVPPVV